MGQWKSVAPEKERFEKYVYPDPNSGCYLWAGACSRKGYGAFRVDRGRRTVAAHRYAWLLDGRELPAGVFVCHKCDTPSCVNPDHLYLGTNKDNMRDMSRKGRGTRGRKGLPYGVVYDSKRRSSYFAVIIYYGGRMRYFGRFQTIEEAATVAMEKRDERIREGS